MPTEPVENRSDRASQNGKAKSRRAGIAAKIARLVRREGLSYDDWRYITRQVSEKCDLRPAKTPKRLPNILMADEFRRFYRVVARPARADSVLDAVKRKDTPTQAGVVQGLLLLVFIRDTLHL